LALKILSAALLKLENAVDRIVGAGKPAPASLRAIAWRVSLIQRQNPGRKASGAITSVQLRFPG
jgi:hypothetical protein